MVRKFSAENVRFTSGVSVGAFTLVFTGTAFGVASALDYRRLSKFSVLDEIATMRKRVMTQYPEPRSYLEDIWQQVRMKWDRAFPGQKAVYALIAANVIIFAGFHFPRTMPFLAKHFLHTATSPAYTVLTSSFAHMQLWHLGFNMLALSSFGPLVAHTLGVNQFLALYLSSGVMAGFVSHLAHGRVLGWASLGASGAIFAIFAAATAFKPDMKVGLIFVPGVSFSAEYGLYAFMLFDALGALFKWGIFDHAAHLGGALTGLAYANYGMAYVYAPLLRFWKWTGLLDRD